MSEGNMDNNILKIVITSNNLVTIETTDRKASYKVLFPDKLSLQIKGTLYSGVSEQDGILLSMVSKEEKLNGG